MREQFAQFKLDQFEQLRVVDQVDLVQEHDQRRHADLAGQQNVFARLRHWTVGCRHDQDAAVHLGGASDHVLDEVGVARTVDVGVMSLLGFVLDVADGDRDRLGLVAHGAAFGDVGVGLGLCQTLRRLNRQQRSGQRGLAVVNVTDGPHVDVGLGPREYIFGHSISLPSSNERTEKFCLGHKVRQIANRQASLDCRQKRPAKK